MAHRIRVSFRRWQDSGAAAMAGGRAPGSASTTSDRGAWQETTATHRQFKRSEACLVNGWRDATRLPAKWPHRTLWSNARATAICTRRRFIPTTRRDTGVRIRRATRADLSTVVELRLALLGEHKRNPVYGRMRPDARDRAIQLYATQLDSPQEVIFLAERAGETVGILRCVHSAGSPLLDPSHYGYVSSVYVIPAARRDGVARSLLAEAESWCLARGLTEIRLHNAADNATATAVWDLIGFEVVEQLRIRPLVASQP